MEKKNNTTLIRFAVTNNDQKRRLLSWAYLATLTLLAIYFYVFMEWLFMVTKPSFMDLMPLEKKLGILLLSGFLLITVVLPLLLLFFVASLIPALSKSWKVFLWVGAFLPAFFMAATAFLMIDNFTYTVFKFGVVTSQGIQRGIYGFIFLLLLAVFSRWVIRRISEQPLEVTYPSGLKVQVFACLALVAFSIPFGGSLFFSEKVVDPSLPNTGSAVKRPDILLIGTDGLNADHMSVYGSRHNTTPFLNEFAKDALLAENDFSNANITTGSLTSMFTGKLPTKTRALYPPDILEGTDAFQHLPGILKKEGYYNVQISVDYYGDADAVNLQDGFVMVDGRSAEVGGLYTYSRQYVPEDAAYFLSIISKRISDRILHIFYIRTAQNPYAQVTRKLNEISDQERVKQVLETFHHIQQPVFVQVYMMGTHEGMYDSYDDAIRDFDDYVQQIVDELDQMGKLEQTLMIVYSDHAQSNERNVRLPLILRFPGGEHVGKIVHNTENLDIAPTILDYLGIQPPDWMTGLSLIRGEPPANRPIFSAIPNFRTKNDWNWLQLDTRKIKPPFYQFGIIDMVVCQKWYSVNTTLLQWQEGEIQGYPTPCDQGTLPDRDQAQQMLLGQLKADGFDVSSLQMAFSQSQGN